MTGGAKPGPHGGVRTLQDGLWCNGVEAKDCATAGLVQRLAEAFMLAIQLALPVCPAPMLTQGAALAGWPAEAPMEPDLAEPEDTVDEEARLETDPTGRYSRVSPDGFWVCLAAFVASVASIATVDSNHHGAGKDMCLGYFGIRLLRRI